MGMMALAEVSRIRLRCQKCQRIAEFPVDRLRESLLARCCFCREAFGFGTELRDFVRAVKKLLEPIGKPTSKVDVGFVDLNERLAWVLEEDLSKPLT
jgi:hypothetical protein